MIARSVRYWLYALAVLLLAACHSGERQRLQLAELERQNRADSLLLNDSLARDLAQWFDRHGTPNEQMRAYYILGRTYADMNEAPMALHCYQEAINRADTTSQDCDFAQLSRVYGQSAAIFYQQGLYRNALEYDDLSVEYSYRGKDTLNALRSYAMKAASYEKLQMADSAIYFYKDAIRLFQTYHYDIIASGFAGGLAEILIDKGETVEAEPYMHDYEQHSGYFDSKGNIAKGREVYYYAKGLYFLKNNNLDSAEYYFRKELQDGKDFNNQNCGSYGLALLYQQKHLSDSAAKYFAYSYAMNDSCFVQMTTHEVEQAKAMYDYSRQQEIARQKELRAQENARNFWIAVALAMTLLLCLSVLFLKYQEKKKVQKYQAEKLRDLQASYAIAQSELKKLRNSEDLTTLVADKERQVKQLEETIAQYKQREFGLKCDEVESSIRKNDTYKDFMRHVNRGTRLSDKDWEAIEQLLAQNLPSFYNFVSVKRYALSDNEYHACLALRLKASSSQTANLLGLSPSSLTLIRKALLLKLFNVEGSAADFDNKLMLYY